MVIVWLRCDASVRKRGDGRRADERWSSRLAMLLMVGSKFMFSQKHRSLRPGNVDIARRTAAWLRLLRSTNGAYCAHKSASSLLFSLSAFVRQLPGGVCGKANSCCARLHGRGWIPQCKNEQLPTLQALQAFQDLAPLPRITCLLGAHDAVQPWTPASRHQQR